ncbi:MAG: DUF87 domain-containing protein [Clostridia bacterium]|nr:DUF87 domain-containing protein [Clostridia bacterium]
MRNEEKERLAKQTETRYLWLRFKNGCKSLKNSKARQLALIAFYILLILIWTFNSDDFSLQNMELVSPVFIALSKLSLPLSILGGTIAILILYGTPIGSFKIMSELQRIGLTNSAGETPILTAKTKDEKQSEVTVFEFDGVGIPLTEWENKRQRIEAALNVHIVKLKEGKNKRSILLYAVPAGNPLSSRIEWNDSYLIKDSSTLVLGKSLMGTVKVDLAKIPHILLGGSTGSGKSVLLKLLLMQAIKKNAVVSIADFKGGVDFPSVWYDKCKICFDEDNLSQLLTGLVDELQRRKVLFRENECHNLDEYNKRTGKALQRYIFACDEVAEILDKTGLTKEQKDKVSLIESKLSVIARQGRAFGIHLILATQRPDANILSGQIRNNIDCRVCGRADNVLSQIILDSTAAAEQIPKDAAGRFLLHDGTIFQAFWFNQNIK